MLDRLWSILHAPLSRPVARTCLIALAVAVFDVLMPLGVSAAALYMAAVLSAVPIRHQRAVIITAVACSLLLALDAFLSPGRGQTELWKVVANFLISLAVVWGTALMADSWIRVQQQQARQTQENQLLLQAMSLSAMAHSFEDALRHCIGTLCEIANCSIGHVYFHDEGRDVLVSSDIWAMPHTERSLDFKRRSEEQTFRRGEGIPGRIWESGRPIWLSDLTDPRFAASAAWYPMRSALGFVIVADERTIAVVEMFMNSSTPPEPQTMLLVGSVGHQLGQVAERRRRAEDRARIASIVETSYDAIIGKDLAGRIISWNKGAELVYGYSESEAVGQSVSIVLPEGMQTEEQHILDALRDRRRLAQFETTRRRKDGRLIDVALTVSPILDSREQLVGSSTIERDITLRKRREQEIQAAMEAAENANRAKSAFLANVSHELRTPMNAVLGMLDLSLNEDLDDRLRDYLDTARDSARTLLHLLNDLLDISRMEAGKLELERAPFRIRDTVDGAIRTISIRASEKGLELASRIARDVPRTLIGDGYRLRQVILNLAGNAVKFTEQGEVVVEVSVAAQHDNRVQLQIAVHDTGIGIAAEHHENIFAAFTQADASTTRTQSGTGLGLAICRELIARMDGRIWLVSEPGQGSTFYCTAWFEIANSDNETLPEVRELANLPVLVVDDNPTNRRILCESLADWSMQPVEADSARAALELLERAPSDDEHFALIIVDALMPDMDGFTLIETIQSEPATHGRSAAILMLSSADRQTFRERADQLDIAAYLEKPVTQSALLDSVMTALHGPPLEVATLQSIAATRTSRRVLVVEDTPANQKVMRVILEKRGHQVQVANNGREGVELVKRGEFDVVLMDVQMPTMDGLQATRAIRELPAETSRRIPIIAMTAHARPEDRDKCLSAGMDAYIGKPIDAAEVLRLVERHWSRHSADGPLTTRSSEVGDTPGDAEPNVALVDLDAAHRRMGGDDSLVADMARMFLDDSPQLLQEIEAGVNQEDFTATQRAAHSLKGLASNFNAEHVVTLAQHLEDQAKDHRLHDARSLASQIATATMRVQQTLQAFIDSRRDA